MNLRTHQTRTPSNTLQCKKPNDLINFETNYEIFNGTLFLYTHTPTHTQHLVVVVVDDDVDLRARVN